MNQSSFNTNLQRFATWPSSILQVNIFLNYSNWNAGLLDENESDVTKEEREQLVIKLAKPSHRIIIAVEACRDWARMDMVNFVKKVDPELSRTIFVYNKFNTHLQVKIKKILN